MRQDKRGSWYLLTGAVLGIALGLFYSWVISPVEYVDAPPYALRADFRDEYRALVAAAYMYSYDLLRAKDRLAQLRDEETDQSLAKQAQQALAAGHTEEEVRALGILAMALGEGANPIASSIASTQSIKTTALMSVKTPTLAPSESQPVSPTQSSTALAPQVMNTPTEVNSETSTPTNGVEFQLQETLLVCNPDQSQPFIQVEMQDSAGQPLAGVELMVTWDGGEDHFFTGLMPEISLGYADFLMTPEVVYSLQVAEGEQVMNDLIAAECLSEDGDRYWGSWKLTFVQP